LQFTGDDFFADKDVCSIVLEVPNFALGGQSSWPVAPHAGSGGRHGRGLDPGGARRAAPATFPCPRSLRRGERCLPHRGAGERYRFRCRLRTCAGAYGWV
jgi:hypothetical protein